MMSVIRLSRAMLFVFVVLFVAGTALAKPKHGGGRGNGGGKCDGPCTQPSSQRCEDQATEPVSLKRGATAALTAAEKESLLAMRREEKLAQDVYVTLGGKYDLRVFSNIAASEVRHQQAVAGLLEKYGIADPVAKLGVGEFDDPAVKALYDQFVARGSQSLVNALQVGVDIELLDIADLKAALKTVKKADIISVYENLLAGSENHLAAFKRVLSSQQR